MHRPPDVPNSRCPSRPDAAADPRKCDTPASADAPDFLERLRSGDEKALARLYEENRGLVRRYLAARVGSGVDVDDLVQETFYQAYRSIGRFEGRSSTSTWLVGIARNVSFRAHRSARRWMCGAHPMSAPSKELSADVRIAPRIDARRMLESCESTLVGLRSAEAAEIFRLRYVDGHSTREVADRVGKSHDSVKMSLRRTRRTMRRGCKGIEELQAAR